MNNIGYLFFSVSQLKSFRQKSSFRPPYGGSGIGSKTQNDSRRARLRRTCGNDSVGSSGDNTILILNSIINLFRRISKLKNSILPLNRVGKLHYH